jgi:hypothetical protein
MRGSGARLLREIGFWLTTAVMSFAFLFVVGETMTDPGGLVGVGYVLAWLVPLAGMVALAMRRPELFARGMWVLVLVPVAVALWGAVDRGSWVDVQDAVGPVSTLLVMVIGTPLAFLGRHPDQTRDAGLAMLAITVVPALLLGLSGGMAIVSMLMMSTPVLITALCYLESAREDHVSHLHVPA